MKLISPFAILLALSVSSFAQTGQSAKEDMKDAGHSTKEAAKKTGKAAKKGTKHAAHATADATEDGAKKVKNATK